MAPTAEAVAQQTSEIIKYLFEDEDTGNNECRKLEASLEPDGPTGSTDDNFDPVLIADQLKTVADALHYDVSFKAALSDLKQAVAEEAIEAAFCRGVEALCQTPVSQRAEVASEMQLIKASVAVGLYLKKSSPELKNKVQSAMIAFLNRRVGTWLTQQGGWGKVNIRE